MDSIKFIITEPYEVKNTQYQSCDIVVQLNKEELPHALFNVNQVVSSYKIDFVEFDLFTCSCGEPGCAGFQSPVFQKKNEATVIWEFPKEDMYKTSKKIYEFDKQQFEEEFLNLFNGLKNLEANNIFVACNFDHMGYEEQELGFVPQPPVSIQEGTEWWTSRLLSESKAHSIISEVVGDSFADTYIVKYDGKEPKYKTSAYYLISSILNDFPRSTSDDDYYEKVKLTATSLSKAINGDNTDIYNIINKSYTENELEPKDFIVRWFWEFEETPELFDMKKISFHQ